MSETTAPLTREQVAELWRQQMYPHLSGPDFMAFFANAAVETWNDVRAEVAAVQAIMDAQRAARARERGTCADCRHWNQMAPFACDAGVSTKYPSWAKDATVPMNPPSNFGCNRREPSLVAAPRALAPSPGDANAD